jgi:hypothetical protein
MSEYTYDSWKNDMLTSCISIYNCPQCGSLLDINDNFYFPDRDTYICHQCNIAFTQITPGEIIITNEQVWNDSKTEFENK